MVDELEMLIEIPLWEEEEEEEEDDEDEPFYPSMTPVGKPSMSEDDDDDDDEYGHEPVKSISDKEARNILSEHPCFSSHLVGPMLKRAVSNDKKVGYYNTDRKVIQRDEWLKLMSDESKYTLRKFDNGRIRAMLYFVGCVDREIFADSWTMCCCRVYNYQADGTTMTPDPVDDRMTFSTVKDGIEWYNDFVADWSESKLEEVKNADGSVSTKLKEVGNNLSDELLAKPATIISDDGDVGAW